MWRIFSIMLLCKFANGDCIAGYAHDGKQTYCYKSCKTAHANSSVKIVYCGEERCGCDSSGTVPYGNRGWLSCPGRSCQCKVGFTGKTCQISRCLIDQNLRTYCYNCQCDPIGTYRLMINKEVELLCSNKKCTCKDGYSGKWCQCADGSYELNEKCEDCQCNIAGSDGVSCSKYGQCNCKDGYEGPKCRLCIAGRFKSDSGECVYCHCNSIGSNGDLCNHNGFCMCKDGYFGRKCDFCKRGYYPTKGSCITCECNDIGATSKQCDMNGFCTCKDLFYGPKCEKCIPGYYFNLTKAKCIDCKCNVNGSTGCHQTGTCICKEKYGGSQCQQYKGEKGGKLNVALAVGVALAISVVAIIIVVLGCWTRKFKSKEGNKASNESATEENGNMVNQQTGEPSYTDIVDPTYMPLIYTRNDNRTYAELNSTQINSGTTERPREQGYLEPAATIKYQNSFEMKTYANS